MQSHRENRDAAREHRRKAPRESKTKKRERRDATDIVVAAQTAREAAARAEDAAVQAITQAHFKAQRERFHTGAIRVAINAILRSFTDGMHHTSTVATTRVVNEFRQGLVPHGEVVRLFRVHITHAVHLERGHITFDGILRTIPSESEGTVDAPLALRNLALFITITLPDGTRGELSDDATFAQCISAMIAMFGAKSKSLVARIEAERNEDGSIDIALDALAWLRSDVLSKLAHQVTQLAQHLDAQMLPPNQYYDARVVHQLVELYAINT